MFTSKQFASNSERATKSRSRARFYKARYLPYRLWFILAQQPSSGSPGLVALDAAWLCRELRTTRYRLNQELDFLEALGALQRVSAKEVRLTLPSSFLSDERKWPYEEPI